MTEFEGKRKSHCTKCGKRLSEKTATGEIVWRAGNVDDSGLYCEACSPPKKNKKGGKKPHS